MDSADRPIILLGCGRLGSALLEGWLATEAVDPTRLIVLTPSSKPAAEAARMRGARINPSAEALGQASIAVLAVKPGIWREAVAPLTDGLAPDATVVSLMAGVRSTALSSVLGNRPIARAMPTTAIAQARGVAAVWSAIDDARALAHTLFDPVADTIDLTEESLIDAATAVAGSAPAFIYAYVEALARAGQAVGLDAEAAVRLARGALRSAGAGAETRVPLSDLIARIASPSGTTEAGLKAQAQAGLDAVAMAAVQAAVARARALGD